MKRAITVVTAIAALVGITASATPADARSCAMIRAKGYGLTDGISKWMATQAVANSAYKWAGEKKHKLSPVKVSCTTPFECSGAAKACKA